MRRWLSLGVLLLVMATLPDAGVTAERFRFEHVALAVRDPGVSVAFYRSIFGLEEIVNRTEVAGIRWMSLGDARELHLISGHDDPPLPVKTAHFAFTAPDFDAFLARLAAENIAFETWSGEPGAITTRADGARQVYLQDPDGYWIEVNGAPVRLSFHAAWDPTAVAEAGTAGATIHNGATLDLAALDIRALSLAPGDTLRLVRPAGLEELLIVRSGTAEVRIDGRAHAGLGPGSVVVTWPGSVPEIRNPGAEALVYHRFAYRSPEGPDPARGESAGGPIVVDWDTVEYVPSDIGGRRQMFDRPTAMFANFEMHVSTLNSGLTNHPAHTHRAEEFVLVIDGRVRLQLGTEHVEAGPGDLVFVESMIPHSLDNIGDTPATYYAFQYRR